MSLIAEKFMCRLQPDDFTVVAGMANGLISMQHRQTPAEARALDPKQSRKDQRKVKRKDRFFFL